VSLRLTDGRVRLRAAADQVVGGTSDLDTDGYLLVRLVPAENGTTGSGANASGAPPTGTQVGRETKAFVQSGGRFAGRFDLTGLDPGPDYRLVVALPTGERVATAPAVVAAATPAPTATATSTPSRRPSLPSNVRVPRGEATTFELTHGDAETVTLVIGSREARYRLVAQVRDADGDGRSTLRFDSAAAGTPRPTLTAVSDDEVLVPPDGEIQRDTRIAWGDYGLEVIRGASIEGRTQDVGSLFVAPAGENATGPGDPAMDDGPPTATPPPRQDDAGTAGPAAADETSDAQSDSLSESRSASTNRAGRRSLVSVVATVLVAGAFLAAGGLVALAIASRRGPFR
jgi:hypothetical protein